LDTLQSLEVDIEVKLTVERVLQELNASECYS